MKESPVLLLALLYALIAAPTCPPVLARHPVSIAIELGILTGSILLVVLLRMQ